MGWGRGGLTGREWRLGLASWSNHGANAAVESYSPMAQFARLIPATIVVVENEALVRLELADRLAKLGFIVLVASDADEAIALLDTHPEVEVLFTDVTMPGSMDGIRLAHHVRDRWPPVKIIVASGMLGAELRDLPGGSLFLSKPYAPESLADALAQTMMGSGPDLVSPQTSLRA
jgi:CheY-like chemotaxis protein